MKISIITVCFNSEKYIADLIKSVAEQSFHDIEHIIIDGASCDETVPIVKSNINSKIKLISEPDSGIYDAMNKGLNLASGDIVGFLNSDDVFASHTTVSEIVNEFNRCNCDIVYGDLVFCADDSLKVVRRWIAGGGNSINLRYGWMPPHPTFYFKREILKNTIKYNTKYKISSDYDFMIKVLRRTTLIAYLPNVLVKMKMGGVSNSSIKNLIKKSYEDYLIIKDNKIGGFITLLCKNLRKIPQFFIRH